jgi:UDP-glucose 4-epimerase
MRGLTLGVTGGGGYVGNILCRQLLELGVKVRVLDNFHKGAM